MKQNKTKGFLTMKGKWLFTMMLTLFLLLAGSVAQKALADMSSPKVSGKTATVAVNGIVYKLIFTQGPFGPMECGTTDVYIGDTWDNSYPYYFHEDTNILDVIGLSEFKYIDGQELILNPGHLLELMVTQQ
jgi:hypothetical protein